MIGVGVADAHGAGPEAPQGQALNARGDVGTPHAVPAWVSDAEWWLLEAAVDAGGSRRFKPVPIRRARTVAQQVLRQARERVPLLERQVARGSRERQRRHQEIATEPQLTDRLRTVAGAAAEHRWVVAHVGLEADQRAVDGRHQRLGLRDLGCAGGLLQAHQKQPQQQDDDRHRHEQLDDREGTHLQVGCSACRHLPPPPETLSIMATSGRKSASTIVPTMPPRMTTMNGSSRLRRLATATSTSSS